MFDFQDVFDFGTKLEINYTLFFINPSVKTKFMSSFCRDQFLSQVQVLAFY